MQFCESHWESLKEAIVEEGMEVLVAETRDGIATKLQRQMQDGALNVDNFDPLWGAFTAIMGYSLEWITDNIGFRTMTGLLQSSDCPLCFLNAAHDNMGPCFDPDCSGEAAFDHWIKRAAEGQKEIWLSLGYRNN